MTEATFNNLESQKAQPKMNPVIRECLAELIGTYVLIMFGDGVVCQKVLFDGLGDHLSIHICWGLAVTFGIYFCCGVSGAHLNPAVTLSGAIFKGFSWFKVLPYMLSQTVGAFLAAATLYSVYYQKIEYVVANEYDGVYNISTSGVFHTGLDADMNNFAAFLNEVIGTALLIGGIYAIVDSKNAGCANTPMFPIAVGLLVVAIGMAFGSVSGYAINPARDFGPRLFTSLAPWGSYAFTHNDYYFWIPIVGPLLGGPIGGAIYTFVVEKHHPEN